ncbi:HNH endonuclease [Candidatus Woesearchaeota archaeon]|nr:HNH endonuclease [Candidatus Woesearchaeota archaeon]
MAFEEDVVKQAWERAGGKCEKCNKSLSWDNRGEETEDGWEAHHRDPNGPDTVSNCEILCQPCHKNTPSYGG